MIASRTTLRYLLVMSCVAVQGLLSSTAFGQTAKTELELRAMPSAELISTDMLEPALRKSVANGAAALLARIMAEDNPWSLAFPPIQQVRQDGYKEIPARRVKGERAVYEHVVVQEEKLVPIIESGKQTGRFEKKMVARHVSTGKKIGVQEYEHLVSDPNGSEKMRVPTYAKDGPAEWRAYLAGLNGMALYVLAKAGLGEHPATVAHAAALAEHAREDVGLPDLTFDLAWMAAGFAALGPDSPHDKLARRLLSKLLDGQIREQGDLEGLWGPVCVNFAYFGKLMTAGQMILHELNNVMPKKLQAASPAEQQKLIIKGKELKAFANVYEKTRLDVFRAGTRLQNVRRPYGSGEMLILPGMPFHVYRWVMSDVESTEAAAFAIAVGKKAGLLPKETERGAVRGKKVHPSVKADAAIKLAAKRLAAAIDDDGSATSLALVAENTLLRSTGFPDFMLEGEEHVPNPQLWGIETACTSVATQESLEWLSAADPAIDEQQAEPRQRARDCAAKIAARWFKESALPAAEGWKSVYQSLKVSHADLMESPGLTVPAAELAADSLPWGPAGSMYRIVPGFRGLFVGESPEKRYKNDLFRQIAYRLMSLQDQYGQWSGGGNHLQSSAAEAVAVNWGAWISHRELKDKGNLANFPDPVPYETLLGRGGGMSWMANGQNDAAIYPTLASLLFLVEAIDEPVSLDGIQILPEPPDEPKPEDAGKPDPKRTPVGAAQSVARPNTEWMALVGSLAGAQWRANPPAKPTAAKPEEKPTAVKEKQKAEPAEADGLDEINNLLSE